VYTFLWRHPLSDRSCFQPGSCFKPGRLPLLFLLLTTNTSTISQSNMAQHQYIPDTHTAPFDPFPNNDISALDGGRFDYPTARVHDRQGNAVEESQEDEHRQGGRTILACLDFNRQDHLEVRHCCLSLSQGDGVVTWCRSQAPEQEPHGAIHSQMLMRFIIICVCDSLCSEKSRLLRSPQTLLFSSTLSTRKSEDRSYRIMLIPA
jgi:hypothetical protein